MTGRRLEERTKILLQIEFDSNKYPLQKNNPGSSEIVDISKNGACIVTNVIPKGQEDIEFIIKIPEKYKHVVDDDSPVHINAKIIDHQGSNEKKSSKYWLRFNNVEIFKTKIKNIIDYENNILAKKDWNNTHPESIFPSVPVDSEMLEGMRPSALSVDVTNICNLRCKHCFWNEYQRQVNQQTNRRILDSVRELLERFKSITNILWYGGEPLLNEETRSIVREGIKLLKNNLIITNGTSPFPDFRENVHYAVSIDGTKKIHNYLRGKDIYGKIKRNIKNAIKDEKTVALLYCINAYNMYAIPDFLREWSDLNLLGIGFTVYTPMINKESFLTQTAEQKLEMVSILQEMKKKYGDLIFNSEKMIELLDPKHNDELVKECPMNLFNNKSRVYNLHLCNDGTVRIPCSIGSDASHRECRSITKVALYAGTVLKDRQSYRSLLRMYLSDYNNRAVKHGRKKITP